jgi:hypothetical protein
MNYPSSSINVYPSPDVVDGKYAYKTYVYLSVSVYPGEVFTGWSGDITGSFTSSSLLLDGNKRVTASFMNQRVGLSYMVKFSV